MPLYLVSRCKCLLVLVAFSPRLVGLQATEDTSMFTKLMLAFAELLFAAAVRVAVWSLLNVAVVALKVAVVEDATTVTEAGTVSAALLLVKVTAAPPLATA